MYNRLGVLLLVVGMMFVLVSCERGNIINQEVWGDIFRKHGVDSACFEWADNTHDQVYVYNIDRCSRRFAPASTFKIMNSLVALESNVAPDENLLIKWDGVARKPEWDKDMNMREAFKVSNVAYYQELARRIGVTEMQHWLDTVRYGNKRIGPKLDECWLNDTLQITPDEQVGFIKKLYFDKLPFSQRTQRIVRSMMMQEDQGEYRLYYKTGTLMPFRSGKDKVMAWLVGFVEKREVQKGVLSKQMETNYRPYFFAMNFEVADTTVNTMELRKAILMDILKERQIISSSM